LHGHLTILSRRHLILTRGGTENRFPLFLNCP
jgi:hypothetical protein